MKSLEAVFGPNSALVEELYKQYQEDPDSVPKHWKSYFSEMDETPVEETKKQDTNGTPPAAEQTTAETKNKESKKETAPAKQTFVPDSSELQRLKGVASKIVDNMDESVYVPTATSLRVLPVKMMTEDRALINSHLLKKGEPKASFTHMIAWAVIQGLKEFPNINSYYLNKEDNHYRVIPEGVNLGIAIDLENKDGSRNLVVPNIKSVDKLNFKEFLHAFAGLIDKARKGKLELSDYQETTISITNPGTIGTVSSVPRLMKGQGAIIATGAINYPAEYQSMAQDVLNQLGISKVMTVTCTYDHRIIQGAESGMFLQKIHALLNGEENFYDQIFKDLEIPYEPFPYGEDKYEGLLSGRGNSLEQDRRAIAVWRLMTMYRLRGHVLANLDPLGTEPGLSPELDLEYYRLSLWDLDREFYCDNLGAKKQPSYAISFCS